MIVKKIVDLIFEKAIEKFVTPTPSDKTDVEQHIDKTAKPREARAAIQKLAHDMVGRNRSKVSKFTSNEPLSPELGEVKEAKQRQSTIVTDQKARRGALTRAWTSQMTHAAGLQTKEHTPASKKPKINVKGASKVKTPQTVADPLTLNQETEYRAPLINENRNIDFGIQKASGIGTFMTSKDLGMKIQGGFALHPSVEEELESRNDKNIN